MGIRQVWKGEETLGKTYWLYFAIPSAALNIIGTFLLASTVSLAITDPRLPDVARWIFVILLLLVVYFGAISVIRAAFNKAVRPKVGLWGWIASVIAVLAMLRVPMDLLGVIPPSESDIDKQFAAINMGLPKKVDEVTTLNRVSYDDRRVTYHYVIADSVTGPVDVSKIKGAGINQMCKTWKPTFDSKEVSAVEYRYLLRGQTLGFFVDPKDCF